VLRRSIRMVVPRFLTGPLSRGAGCYSLERTVCLQAPPVDPVLFTTPQPVTPGHYFSCSARQSLCVSHFVSEPFLARF
jgi:hypothetical protein